MQYMYKQVWHLLTGSLLEVFWCEDIPEKILLLSEDPSSELH